MNHTEDTYVEQKVSNGRNEESRIADGVKKQSNSIIIYVYDFKHDTLLDFFKSILNKNTII